MSENFRLLYPPDYNRAEEIPMRNFQFIHSLQIDSIILLARENYRGLTDLSLENFFTTNPKVLEYRLAIVEDLIQNPPLYETFRESIPIIHDIFNIRRIMGSTMTIDTALSSIRLLEMYQEIVDLFAGSMKELAFQSEGLKTFSNYIATIADSSDYQNMRVELGKMKRHFGNIKSVTIGVNLDRTLQPQEAGIISIGEQPFHQGTIMERLLKKKSQDSSSLMTPIFPLYSGLHSEDMNALNASIRSALDKIFAKSIRTFEPIIQKYFNINTTFFVSLLDDIRFLATGVRFVLSMKELGFSMCRPQIAPVKDKKCTLENVYNPILAKKSIEQAIIANSFTFDENGRFYIVTGPNHGGKSIFAYSIGIAQALFQLGLFVPAESALMSPVSGIYTHFPSSDENNYGKGRLESECARLSNTLDALIETDLLLMDESFSSTSALEAGYIASEVITGIGVIGCGGLFVTHIHGLSQEIEAYNSHPQNKGTIDNLVALMENKEDGSRSYKIARTKPDGLSYAKDIASKYNLDLDGILSQRDTI